MFSTAHPRASGESGMCQLLLAHGLSQPESSAAQPKEISAVF
jgi:hypothetical protein